MNPWELIYVIAGAAAIVTIVWAIALDALELARWAEYVEEAGYNRYLPPPRILGSARYAGAIAVLVGLWLAAAVLR